MTSHTQSNLRVSLQQLYNNKWRQMCASGIVPTQLW
jgi:hypothetical protein